jgi:transposase
MSEERCSEPRENFLSARCFFACVREPFVVPKRISFMHDANSLAKDLEAARQRNAELSAQLQTHKQELQTQIALAQEQARALLDIHQAREQLQQENVTLQLTIEKLMRQLYGNRRERFVEDPTQRHFKFNDDPQVEDMFRSVVADAQKVIDEAENKKGGKKRQRKKRKEQLPAHLPRVEKIVDVAAEQKHCQTHGARQMIGFDTTETLVLKRPELYVLCVKYPKYACSGGGCTATVTAPVTPIASTAAAPEATAPEATAPEATAPEATAPEATAPEAPVAAAACGIVQAERPAGLVEGNRYDTSIATEVVVQKYGYHLPFYRQQDWFSNCGWVPSRSTLLNILVAAEFVLRPLAQYYHRLLMGAGGIGCDETTVKLIVPPVVPPTNSQDPRSRRVHEVLSAALKKQQPSVIARMWAYRAVDLPFNVFDFTVSRHRDGPEEILAAYSGKLLGDCWSGFQKIALRMEHRLERAACWAHARRKVFEAVKSHPDKATMMLALIRQLYDIEDRGKSLTVEERLALRQRESVPLLTKLQTFMASDACARVLPKSALGEALRYLRNHWSALMVYTTDGLIPIDNNEVEQLMKQVALGRKNWLYFGSVEAGTRAATLLTIISTALRNDLDVWAYVKDVLDQLLAGSTDYAALRADTWKQQHPEHVRVYRAEERQEASDRRQYERAKRRIAQASASQSDV